jgi:hypothetical protein
VFRSSQANASLIPPRRGIIKSANQERFGGSRFRGFLKR